MDNVDITTTTTDTPEPVTEVVSEVAATESDTPTDDSTDTFSAEYVRGLRRENAEARVRAKLADAANDRLLAAYVNADGRLIDPDLITVGEDVLGDDGLIDSEKVKASIDALIAAKPQYQKIRPAVIPQGVREEAPVERGLFTLLRERM